MSLQKNISILLSMLNLSWNTGFSNMFYSGNYTEMMYLGKDIEFAHSVNPSVCHLDWSQAILRCCAGADYLLMQREIGMD